MDILTQPSTTVADVQKIANQYVIEVLNRFKDVMVLRPVDCTYRRPVFVADKGWIHTEMLTVTWSGKIAFASGEMAHGTFCYEKQNLNAHQHRYLLDRFPVTPGSFQARYPRNARINIPQMPIGARLRLNDTRKIVGYQLHELGHLLFTDMEKFKLLAMKKGQLFKNVLNGIEDPRIEKCMIDSGHAPGAQMAFEALLNHLLALAPKWTPNSLPSLPFTLAVMGRVLNGYQLACGSIDALLQRVNPANRWVFELFVARFPVCRTFDDVVTLTTDIITELEQRVGKIEVDDHPGPDGDRPVGTDETGDKTDGEKRRSKVPADANEDADADGEGDEGAGEGDDADGEGDDADGEGDDADGEGDDADGEGDTADDTEQTTGGNGWSKDQFEAAQRKSAQVEPDRVLDDLAKRVNAGKDQSQFALALGGKAHWRERDPLTPEEQDERRIELEQLNASLPLHANAISAHLTRILWAPERVGWTRLQNSGRFDRRSLTRLANGSENVFNRRWEQPGVETAVSLLIDMSGSMGGERASMCRSLAFILGRALEKCRTKFEVVGFDARGSLQQTNRIDDGLMESREEMLRRRVTADTTKKLSEDQLRRSMSKLDREGYKRRGRDFTMGDATHGGTDLYVVKTFKETMREVEQYMVRLNQAAYGGTHDAGAVLTAAHRLSQVAGVKRRVLFVLSDGAGDSKDLMDEVLKTVAGWGVEVIGLGIQTNLCGRYPVCVDVFKLEDLIKTGMTTLVRQIEQSPTFRRAS